MTKSVRRGRVRIAAMIAAIAVAMGSGAAPALAEDDLVQSVTVNSVKLSLSAKTKVTVTVRLHELEPGYTIKEATATLLPDGAPDAVASIELTETSPGVLKGSAYLTNDAKVGKWWVDTLSLWIEWDNADQYYGSFSPASFYVKRATQLSLNASPEPVKKGRTITVSGKLTRLDPGSAADSADASYRGYAGRTVKIYFDPTGSKPRAYIGSAVTTSAGAFTKAFVAKVDGTWSAQFAGTDSHSSVKSAGDWLDVR